MGSSAIGVPDTPPATRITKSISERQNAGRSSIDLEMHLIGPELEVATPSNASVITPRQSRSNVVRLVQCERVPDAKRVFRRIQVHGRARGVIAHRRRAAPDRTDGPPPVIPRRRVERFDSLVEPECEVRKHEPSWTTCEPDPLSRARDHPLVRLPRIDDGPAVLRVHTVS